MSVLVTGGAGFIGANLCRELAARPEIDAVIALDDLSTGSAENLRGVNARLIEGSILDRGLLAELVDAADAVVHLAALPSVPRSLADPLGTFEVNATGTVHVLEACRRKSRYVVAASSSSVYGNVPVSPKHEDLPTRPLSPYAMSKLTAEAGVLAYGAAFGLPTLALRFFNVYGPLQTAGHAYAAVIPTFITSALQGGQLQIYGDGGQVRDFTFVTTVTSVLADAVLRQVTSPVPVNLAFGTRVSVAELAERVATATGMRPQVRHRPPRPGEVRESQADCARFRALFPDARAVSLDQGLSETVAWFRQTRPGLAVPEQRGSAPDRTRGLGQAKEAQKQA
jgi:UDP-glucose 4-epimerase